MISKKMEPFVKNSSVVRALFEEGLKMAEKYGKENVFDFSLGNPNVPAPKEVRDAIIDVLSSEDPNKIHGYMPNQGFPETRAAVANDLNQRFGTDFSEKDIIMSVGAASALNVTLKTILDPEDEVVVFAPYFLEYGNYVKNYDGKLIVIPANIDGGFMPDVKELEKVITPKTKAVLINNPNNPTGIVYSEAVIKEIAAVLERKQTEFNTVIYIISDEPYRELVYDGIEVPFVAKHYDNTIICYSYSKSLSLPGERIGYIAVPSQSDEAEDFVAAAITATRITGAVNAPSLIQLAIAKCTDCKADVDYYHRNGKLLYDELTNLGFECTKPQGAFYLWVKSPDKDEKEFVNEGKKQHILMVPGSSFACPGYVRIAYCVSYEMIQNSLPHFEELAKVYK